jgi:acyl carrier protein
MLMRTLIPQVRRFMEQYLPDYMIPAAFVLLDRLPLTPNGKIDYNTLPVPDQKRPDLEKAFIAPRTDVEEVIADIWSQVLNIEQVGVNDNFFELGGHSLLATQVFVQVRKAFRTGVALRSLFENPTVAGLADLLVKQETSPGQMMAVARLRKKLKGMSQDEIRALLREKGKIKG